MPATALERDALYTIFVTKLGVNRDAIAGAEETPLTDLGLDSLAVLELETVLSSEYGARLPDEAAGMTFNDILAHVNAHPAERV